MFFTQCEVLWQYVYTRSSYIHVASMAIRIKIKTVIWTCKCLLFGLYSSKKSHEPKLLNLFFWKLNDIINYYCVRSWIWTFFKYFPVFIRPKSFLVELTGEEVEFDKTQREVKFTRGTTIKQAQFRLRRKQQSDSSSVRVGMKISSDREKLTEEFYASFNIGRSRTLVSKVFFCKLV